MEKIEGIRKTEEFLAFVQWMAIPAPERKPKHQKELAKKLGVSEVILSEWKDLDIFWDRVRKERRKWAKDKVSNVLLGLYRKAIKEGNAAEAKLFLEYAEEYEESFSIKRELTDADKKLLKRALEYGGLGRDKRKNNK